VQLEVVKNKKRAFCQTALQDVVREILTPSLTVVTSLAGPSQPVLELPTCGTFCIVVQFFLIGFNIS